MKGTVFTSELDRNGLRDLLPYVHQLRDVESGGALAALLRIIDEQVQVVRDDIEELYENWFIETCADWVVPYIGDLLGIAPGVAAPDATDPASPEARLRSAFVVPRRDVANAVRHRRRKGTLALLEDIAADVADWPARAVEAYRQLAVVAHPDHLHLDRARTLDLRLGDQLDRIGGAFDDAAHLADVRRPSSHRARGRTGIPDVDLFVWRLLPHRLDVAPARNLDRARNRFTFDVLGVDQPLMTRPIAEPGLSHVADELNVPAWIRRRAFAERTGDYYGRDRSVCIWRPAPGSARREQPHLVVVPLSEIVAADLTDWQYQPAQGQVSVDPVLGRVAFAPRAPVTDGLWVTYHHGFPANLGGGTYARPVRPVGTRKRYTVSRSPEGPKGDHHTLESAYRAWQADRHAKPPVRDAVIEILDDEEYVESVGVGLRPGDRLEIRAAQGHSPLIRLLDLHANRQDSWSIEGFAQDDHDPDNPESDGPPTTGAGGPYAMPEGPPEQAGAQGTSDGTSDAGAPEGASDGTTDGHGGPCGHDEPCDDPDHPTSPPRLVLDGLTIAGRSVRISGHVGLVVIRHSTLVPGWWLDPECCPTDEEEPSLELEDVCGSVVIEHAIVGSILVDRSEVMTDPMAISISDTIVDATRPDLDALSGLNGRSAHARLTIRRATIFGIVRAHSIEIAENTIFQDGVRTIRRQLGCIRYSYVPTGSRTPRRYRCQPDLVRTAVTAAVPSGQVRDQEVLVEELRVRPRFNSIRYRRPEYAQLAEHTAEEIAYGADDGSEMGAFHDLFQPLREANLRARLDEYIPAGSDAGIFFET